MGRPTQSARLQRWRGQWYLFYTDHRTGRKVRKSCTGLRAGTPEARRALLRHYRELEAEHQVEALRRGWVVSADAMLIADIDLYLADCRDRVSIRQENPEARDGLSAATMLRINDTVGHFRGWLEATNRESFKSADLDVNVLDAYFRHVVRESTRLGERRTKRSAATINIYKRNVKACLRWIQRQRPRRFVDVEELLTACRPLRTVRKLPAAFTPDLLCEFLNAALAREAPDRVVTVEPGHGKRRRRTYAQPATAKSSTPVSQLFLLLVLTGARLGEVLQLRWKDVDLKRGRVVIQAGKTGMLRWLPLTMAPEGEVAPRLLELLRAWREERPAAEFVLPHGNLPAPLFPKLAWSEVGKSVGCARLMPQRLRQNFTSYAASLGIPAAVAAMWQGHSVEVAERHYRAQVLERGKDARSMEAAMGLEAPIRRLIELSS